LKIAHRFSGGIRSESVYESVKRTADSQPLVISSFQSSVPRTLDKSHRDPSATLGYFLSVRFADAERMTFAARHSLEILIRH